MEETTVTHMETDVSSTTGDVLDMQEVTGSDGNVEMVVIVEQVNDDVSNNCLNNDDSETSQEEDIGNQNSISLSQISPTKKSPYKGQNSHSIIDKSAIRPEVIPNPDVQHNNSLEIIDLVHSEETVDSSCKTDTQISPNKESLNKSSNKEIQNIPEKEIQSSPNKETQRIPNKEIPRTVNIGIQITSNKEIQRTPNKEIQRTPNKEIQRTPNKDIQRTPNKEIQRTPNKEIQRTPNKEIQRTPNIEIQRTPNKDMQRTPIKDTQRTPNKEIQLYKEIKRSPIKVSQNTSNSETEITLSTKYQSSQNMEIEISSIKRSEATPDKITTDKLNVQNPPQILSIKLQEAIRRPIKEISENLKINGKHGVADTGNIGSNGNTVPIEVMIGKESSNDSQMDTGSDISERDHNKSISRELKSLINSAKESKIISECTQLTSKTRKSRSNLDTSNTSLNASVEADKILVVRRNSSNSLKSNSSEKSEKIAVKRSMRSQNPEFANKVKLFLNSVKKAQKYTDDISDVEMEEVKSKEQQNNAVIYTPKRKRADVEIQDKSNKLRSDSYCWRCHWAVEQPVNEKTHVPMECTVCPRSFHYKCLSGVERSKIDPEKSWVCPECMGVLHAESSETRSVAMKKISLGMLQELLKYALERMMVLNGVEPFMQPVDRTAFTDYDKYVVHPMDLTLMKQNIELGRYGSTEAFLADAQWILHNSIIFNTLQSKLTGGARGLVRSCRAEMGEIEACPECYAAAHARRPTWFTDVCSTPHVLLWAKLKGFPYWPAKGMSVSNAGMVDVRFFGAHDRAWVPAKDCYLYSEKDPNNFRTKRQDILDSMQEAEQHIRNISRKYGKFVYPPFKTQFEPLKLNEQLKIMIPSFEGEIRTPIKEKRLSNSSSPLVKDKSRSHHKSFKYSAHEGDMSDGEETVLSRKMADGAEIARVDDDFSIEKDTTMEGDKSSSRIKDKESSRKRRRSNMEEAIITIMDSKEKRKRLRNENKVNSQEPSCSSNDIEMKALHNKGKDTNVKKEEVTSLLKVKSSEPANILSNKSEIDKTVLKVAPIKIIATPKGNRQIFKTSTPNDADEVDKSTSHKQKSKSHKTSHDKDRRKSKDEKSRHEKRRNSRHKRSLINDSNIEDKHDKTDENIIDKSTDSKNNSISNKNLSSVSLVSTDKSNKQNGENLQDCVVFDDDTSLAVIARETKSNSNHISCLPTISCVRSLSTIAQSSSTTTTTTTASNKTLEVTIEPTESNIFRTTSTENVRNMKEAASKLEKLRNNADKPVVGRVGVRAFARMASSPEKQPNKDVEVEIKAEPVDLDDADRHNEKMDLMNAFQLRPVNPQAPSLREVRINKVVVTPVTAKKVPAKITEMKPRAKKTFPVPRKPDENRSELNGKNSMVYIPIQPPATPGPAPRPPRPAVLPSNSVPPLRAKTQVITSIANVVHTSSSVIPALGAANPSPPLLPLVSAAGPSVPTTVHTVPLITSVNGQWTFSLQPIMSVGGLDGTHSPPLINGLPERNSGTIMPLSAAAALAAASNTSQQQSPALPSITAPAPQVTASTPAVPVKVITPVTPATPGTPGTASTQLAPKCSCITNDASAKSGELPRLQQRPALMNPLDTNTPVGLVPPPSTAGPVTAKLNQNAVKLTDFFRTLLEDTLEKVDDPSSQLATLRMQLERCKWRHQQEVDEIKHNHDLTLAEMRASFEREKKRAVSEARRAAQVDLEAAVKLTKSKQWCVNCSQEAQFYCCWNTSYCDYPCQRAHWSQHYAVCAQQRLQDGINSNDKIGTPPESRLQPQPDLPKAAPELAAASPLARLAPDHNQKTSIIMSMVEDTSGNQTMKCVGTYKPAASSSAPAPIPPVTIVNKQVIAADDNNASKKVVTSGGYLIVGSNNNTPLVTAGRRSHAIQYFT